MGSVNKVTGTETGREKITVSNIEIMPDGKVTLVIKAQVNNSENEEEPYENKGKVLSTILVIADTIVARRKYFSCLYGINIDWENKQAKTAKSIAKERICNASDPCI